MNKYVPGYVSRYLQSYMYIYLNRSRFITYVGIMTLCTHVRTQGRSRYLRAQVCTTKAHRYVGTCVRWHVRTLARAYVRTCVRSHVCTFARAYVRTCARSHGGHQAARSWPLTAILARISWIMLKCLCVCVCVCACVCVCVCRGP